MTTVQLLNSKQLAAAMNRGQTFVLAMRRAGYSMQYDPQSTLEHALKWRSAFQAAHGRFVAWHYLRKDWRSLNLPTLTLEEDAD